MEDVVDDTGVKHLALDFETGQRVLSQVHLLCQVTRVCATHPACGLVFPARTFAGRQPDRIRLSLAGLP